MKSITLSAIALSLSMMAGQSFAADPAKPSPDIKAQCKGSTGATKAECEKVANEMQKPNAPTGASSPEADDASKVHHSGPAMETQEEKVVKDARQQGKDPKKEIDKLKKSEAAAEEKRNH